MNVGFPTDFYFDEVKFQSINYKDVLDSTKISSILKLKNLNNKFKKKMFCNRIRTENNIFNLYKQIFNFFLTEKT